MYSASNLHSNFDNYESPIRQMNRTHTQPVTKINIAYSPPPEMQIFPGTLVMEPIPEPDPKVLPLCYHLAEHKRHMLPRKRKDGSVPLIVVT
jgi:hypothetical protein